MLPVATKLRGHHGSFCSLSIKLLHKNDARSSKHLIFNWQSQSVKKKPIQGTTVTLTTNMMWESEYCPLH